MTNWVAPRAWPGFLCKAAELRSGFFNRFYHSGCMLGRTTGTWSVKAAEGAMQWLGLDATYPERSSCGAVPTGHHERSGRIAAESKDLK